MYPPTQHQYPLMNTGTAYHQPLLQHHITYPTHQQSQPPIAPPEPLPNATDVHTITLSISQLADFSATMVHLLWHERNSCVISHQPSTTSGNRGTSSAFKKYCRSILQATQLSESVVLLSLKYIALLLRNNPQLRGAEGSEYRLYTVALMLANKFLDDNTFTNKTWSDISGMKMHELNMMEFEFLDVLQYLLFIQKCDFDQWKTTLFNFRNQLHDSSMSDDNLCGLQQQQFIETTLKLTGTPLQYEHHQQQQDSRWIQHHQLHQHEVAMQYHQQQQTAAAVAAQQQYNQHLYLLSKAQQPHIPPQQLNRPLTRVPLRIPVRPLYQQQGGGQASSSSISTTHTSTTYDSSLGSASATVVQPSSTIATQQQTQPTHTPHRTYDHADLHRQQNHHHQQQQSTSSQVIAPSVPQHGNFYSMELYPQQTSIHQPSIRPLNNNGPTGFAAVPTPLHQVPSTQPTSTAPPTFYYNTPSATPISSHSYHHDHSQPPSHQHHHHSTDYINSNGINNPPHQANYGNQTVYYMNPSHQHTVSTPTGYGEYKNYSATMTPVTTHDTYGRPPMGRMSTNPSYQHQNGLAEQTSLSAYQPSIATTVLPSSKRLSMTEPTSGPVPEDPLTAAESYRVPSYD